MPTHSLDTEIRSHLEKPQDRRRYLRVTRRALWLNATKHTLGTERLRNEHVRMLRHLCTLFTEAEWPELHRTFALALCLPGWRIVQRDQRRET